MSKIYGCYSEKQADIYGVWEYTRPEGGTVLVSSVGEDPAFAATKFDDKKLLGEIGDLVRRVRYGMIIPYLEQREDYKFKQ